MLTLYGYPVTRAMRVLWALEEVGAEYRYVKVDFTKDEHQSPAFTRLNPGGKVPVLVDGDLVLTESAAICTYIGEKFEDGGLVPAPRTPERALYDQWCYFVMTELEPPLATIAMHRFGLPEDLRVPAVIKSAQWEFARAMRVLALGLGDRPFIVGDRFTMADILIAHALGWAIAFHMPFEDERVGAYGKRMTQRPAYARMRDRQPDVESLADL